MKKLIIPFIVAIVSLAGSQVSAQSFGLKLGFNSSNINIEEQGLLSINPKANMGFHIGFTTDLALTDILSVETDLLFSTKGYSIKVNEDIVGGDKYNFKLKSSPAYLELPIALKAGLPIASDARIFAKAGAYFAYGIGGSNSMKVTDGDNTISETSKIVWGSSEDDADIKPFDAGVQFGGGVEIGKMQLSLAYQMGLINTTHSDDNNITNRVFSISFAYYLF